MLINGSYGSVMQGFVLLSAKYRFFAKLPDYLYDSVAYNTNTGSSIILDDAEE